MQKIGTTKGGFPEKIETCTTLRVPKNGDMYYATCPYFFSEQPIMATASLFRFSDCEEKNPYTDKNNPLNKKGAKALSFL